MPQEKQYVRRLADNLLDRLLAELPAVLLVGPRACGKTTTALRRARTVLRLDRSAEAVAVQADPDAVLRGLPEPVLLDEWQAVPSVLGAVKRAVDSDPRPGRFLLTGSVRAELDGALWPGTGRLTRVPVTGMSVRERVGDADRPSFVDRLIAGDDLRPRGSAPDLRGYVEIGLESGFPEAALRLTREVRVHWLESYVDQILTRDAAMIDHGRDSARLRRYFEAIAVNTAGVVEHKTLWSAAGINRKTALAYDRLLEDLLVVEALPAWWSNRLKRLVRTPKRYVLDPALCAAGLRMDANAILRQGDLLGRFVDTFVAAQLRAEAGASAMPIRLHHLRQEEGRREVDILAEISADRVIAVEVKADSSPTRAAASHLAWLRDALGERFVRGVVLHTGPRSYELEDRLVAAPIASLWM